MGRENELRALGVDLWIVKQSHEVPDEQLMEASVQLIDDEYMAALDDVEQRPRHREKLLSALGLVLEFHLGSGVAHAVCEARPKDTALLDPMISHTATATTTSWLTLLRNVERLVMDSRVTLSLKSSPM